ncbi:MAG: tetratricopeptide repeat protein [Myxococcales bacterium]|nr:tetratricopeptide repeat protein [Myxococcales bacterium]
MTGAPPTTPIDPTELLEDFGHYGSVSSITFEYVGVEIDRLSAAAHRLRAFNLWDARTHANTAFTAMPEHLPCAYFVALTDGAFPYAAQDRWEDALASLRRNAPERATSNTVLEALALLAAHNAARMTECLARAKSEGVHPTTIAALEALQLAKMFGDPAKAAAVLREHRGPLALQRTAPIDAANELYARWARRAQDRQSYEQATAAIAARHPADAGLALARARFALSFHDGVLANGILDAVLAAGAQLTPDLRGTRGRAKLLCYGANDALPELEAALTEAGDSPAIDRDDRVEWLLAKATAESAQQKQLAAERDITEAIRLAPRRASSFVRRSQLRAALVRHANAAQDLESALQIQPLDCPDTALGDLAMHLFNAREYARSIPVFDRAIRDAVRRNVETNRRAHIEELRGAALHFVGRFADAVAAYNRTLALVPTHGKALSDRGEALLELDRDEAAFADLERAVQLGYRASCTFVARGTYFQRKGDYTKAIAEFDEAARLSPTSAQPLELRAKCYEATGDIRRASDDRERAAVLRATRR